jgi:hypothetical protein
MQSKRRPVTMAESNAAPPQSPTFAAVRIGYLLPESSVGNLVVGFDGNAAGPASARTTLALDALTIASAAATRRPVVLVFEEGDVARPIVLGIIESGEAPSPFQQLMTGSARKATRPVSGPAAGKQPDEARIDGRRVVLEGADEVVLRCGDASLTLRRDGRVVVRGAYIETHAKGVNRIKGGTVKIN